MGTATDQRQPESTNEQVSSETRKVWPGALLGACLSKPGDTALLRKGSRLPASIRDAVSLFGCLEHAEVSSAIQESWPWFLLKACLCPAAALGANETLYQEEEPADICCLQPHSLCGPACRELNAQLCGLGNEGLRLCAHTCLLQAACSCLCLGLPLVAWATALQRQRVAAKHGVQDTEEEFWVTTAFFPASLLQIHTLLQQQQQQHQQPCRQAAAAAAYKAPKVQQMAASECASVGQAPSAAGPLTSGMSTSKLMRAVRTESTRSESVAQQRARTAGSRLGDSISSDTSSGVVDNPYGLKQSAETDPPSEEASAACLTDADGSAEATATHKHQQRRGSLDGQQHSSSGLEHCNSSSRLPAADGPLHMGSPCLTARSGAGSRPSSRGAAPPAAGPSSNGGCAIEPGPLSARLRAQGQGTGSQHNRNAQLPPKHRSSINGSLPGKAVSGGGGGGRPSTSGAGSGSNPPALPAPQPATSPEPLSAGEPAAAEAAGATSGQLGQQPTSTSSIAGAADGCAGATGAAAAAGGAGNYRRSAGSLSQAGGIGSSSDNLTGSRLSIAGSGSKLQLSQEDVPLLAIKPCPGRAPRGMSTGLSSSKNMLGKGSLAGSWQQRSSGSDKQLIAAGRSSQDQSGATSSSSNATSSSAHSRPLESSNGTAGGSGAAALQVNPQYATMQSDICNFASWLGGAGASIADLQTSPHSPHQPQQQLPARQSSVQEEDLSVQHQVQLSSMGNARSGAGVIAQVPPSPPPPLQLSRGPSATIPSFRSDGSEQLGQLDLPVRQDSGLVSVNVSKSPNSSSQHKTGSILAGRNGDAAAAAGVQQATGGRARMSDWAYMSDLCNLGGSFEMNCSTGLAAALGRLAEEGYGENTIHAVDETADGYGKSSKEQQQLSASKAAAASSMAAAGQQQQCRAPPRAASGSWPDANPSPPSTLHDTLESQPAPSNGTAADAAAATVQAAAATGRAGRASAACIHATGSNTVGAAAVAGAGTAAAAAAAAGASREPAAAAKGARKLDREMLAAVTGTSGTEDLTASQEELAAKLAKLAFATPAAARQLAGKRVPQQQQQQQQQQQRQEQMQIAQDAGGGAWGGCEDRDEPFYPTMMSDMCNLAEPLDEELEGVEEDPAAGTSSTQGLLSAAAAASAAQQSVLHAVQQQGAPGLQKQQQQWQQQQRVSHNKQQRAGAGRPGAPAVKAGALTAAAAAAAGPLKSALMMRGGQPPAMRQAARPGMARQVSAGGATAAASAAARQGIPVGAASAASAYPLESFDSYFPDADIHYRHSMDTAASKPGKTFTVTDGGVVETPGVSQFAEGCGQQNGAAAAAAAGVGGLPVVMLSNAAGAPPPKSPKRMLGGLRDGALSCESAAAAADIESDVRMGWQDVSRSASPAVGEARACSPGLKGRAGGSACTSVQTSTSLWPIVDASVEAQGK